MELAPVGFIGAENAVDPKWIPARSVPGPAPARVLYVEANEDGTVGGTHRMLLDLLRHLDRSRYEPVVLFYQQNPYVAQVRALGVEVLVYAGTRQAERAVHLSGRRLAKLAEVFRAVARRRRFLREHRIDMVHINNSPCVGNDDWLPAARLLGIPCVANVMGDARGESHPVRRWLFRGFDHYLPISRYIAQAMRRQGIAEERMDLVYLGVDVAAFRARIRRSREAVRADVGVAPHRLLAVMVGNVRHWKGQHVVLAALERLSPAARERVHVAFAGGTTPADEPYLRSLREEAARLGVDDRVSFLGARDDVPDLLNAADLAIHASVKPEPFGLVVVEAMAAAMPVLAANTGGPAEVLTPESGVVYDPSDPGQLAAALEELIGDSARRVSLGRRAYQRVQQFTVGRYVEGIERVYARVLPGGRARQAAPAG